MAVKIYNSLVAEDGSFETYKTALAQIQEKANLLNATCSINATKQIVTIFSESASFIQKAVLDFSGNVITNGPFDENGNFINDSRIMLFNTLSHDFVQVQNEIRENLGPYALIKVGLNGDIELLKALTAHFTQEQKEALIKDMKVIGDLADSNKASEMIDKCEKELLGKNSDEIEQIQSVNNEIPQI